MSSSIAVDLKSPTNLSALKGTGATARSLRIEGAGNILLCILSFYKEGQKPALHRDLYFKGQAMGQPREFPCDAQDFQVSEYDYCRVELLSGWVGDKLLLVYEV